MKCQICGTRTVKAGTIVTRKGRFQWRKCQTCGRVKKGEQVATFQEIWKEAEEFMKVRKEFGVVL